MRRGRLRNGLGVGFLLLGGAATLLAATPPTVGVLGGDDQPGPIVITPSDVRHGNPSLGNPNPALTPAAKPVRPGNPLWAIPIKDLSITRERPAPSTTVSVRPPRPTTCSIS